LFLLHTLGAFIVAILILVSLHELGHLLVARWCGIKVLRFSVGFGKPFFNKRWRNIEWCLAPIPLGGYVKMVDTREGDVAEADLPYAFDKQHPFKRMLVVAVLLTVVTSLVGVYLAFFLDSAPAPTIVLLLALQFIVALGISTRRERRAQASLSLPDRLPAQELP